MQESVTIKDVAAYAGVAVSTVSRVMNNRDRVSPKTREAVKNAIEELGYVRNNLAASIRGGNTHFIVTVVPDIINEFYSAVIRGVEVVSKRHGYHTLVCAVNDIENGIAEVFDSELQAIVDGIVMVPSVEKDMLCQIGKPLVVIDRLLPERTEYSVELDNYRGACRLTQELIDNGHKKIAVITGKSDFNVFLDRMRGYQDTMEKNGIKIREEYICVGDWYQETGQRFTRQLLEMSDPPTAIFSFNNQICLGSAKFMLSHGYQIGKDISLVEFDDWLVAEYLGPGITSIRGAVEQMGEIGAEMLFSLLNHKQVKEKNKVLDVELVRRGSVAKL